VILIIKNLVIMAMFLFSLFEAMGRAR
jgi:hypothetical protein